MTQPLISLIAARTKNGVIGADGGMPWHLPADLKHFKALTLGKPIIMGRTTYQSIGKPLPKRQNIVLTRSSDMYLPGVHIAQDWPSALALAGNVPEIMVIGGGQIYAMALPDAGRIYVTEIDADIPGDTHFPNLDPALWVEDSRQTIAAEGSQPALIFRTLSRKGV